MLGYAKLQGASLNDTKLQEASLYGAHLQGASLLRAQLQAARLDRAQLQGARLDGAALLGAFLDGASLAGVSDSRADWRGTRFGERLDEDSLGELRKLFPAAPWLSARLRVQNSGSQCGPFSADGVSQCRLGLPDDRKARRQLLNELLCDDAGDRIALRAIARRFADDLSATWPLALSEEPDLSLFRAEDRVMLQQEQMNRSDQLERASDIAQTLQQPKCPGSVGLSPEQKADVTRWTTWAARPEPKRREQ
jgi:hypothetical protein